MARTAGLLAVAVFPALAGISQSAYADPVRLSTGFHHAVLIAAGMCVAGGLLSAATIRRDVLEGAAAEAGTDTHSVVHQPLVHSEDGLSGPRDGLPGPRDGLPGSREAQVDH